MRLEPFARVLLEEPRGALVSDRAFRPPPVLAIWIGYLYGYAYSHVDVLNDPKDAIILHFVRDDEPEARRRAAWMRDPASDPALEPPVRWVFGGDGFNPPGWRPDVRLVVPPGQLMAQESMVRQLEREAGARPHGPDGDPGRYRRPFEQPGGGPRRQVHPPGPAPGTIAWPDAPPPYPNHPFQPGGDPQ